MDVTWTAPSSLLLLAVLPLPVILPLVSLRSVRRLALPAVVADLLLLLAIGFVFTFDLNHLLRHGMMS